MRHRLATCAVLGLAPALASAHHTPSAVIFSHAGTGAAGYLAGRAPSEAHLNGPAGLVADAQGGYYVADTINQRVRRVRTGIRVAAGNGGRGDTGDGGRATDATLQDPTALELHPRGLLIADTANDRVRIVGPDGVIRAFAGAFEQGFEGDGGPAVAARLNGPEGLEVAPDGTVFIADTGNDRVRAVAPGGTIRTVAAGLSAPRGLALAPDGALLVADSGSNRLLRVAAGGAVTTVAGNGGAASGGDGGPATAAGLNRPSDVAVAADGSLYVVEAGGNRVRRIAPDGTISRFAGAGGPRYRGDGGPAAAALLNAPRAVEVHANGHDVLIADTDNNVVRYVTVPGSSPLLALASTRPAVRARLRANRVAPVAFPFQLSLGARVGIAIRERRGRRVARFSVAGRPGPNRPVLPRRFRVGARRLTKGRYTVRLTAAAGSRGRAFQSMELTVK